MLQQFDDKKHISSEKHVQAKTEDIKSSSGINTEIESSYLSSVQYLILVRFDSYFSSVHSLPRTAAIC